MTLIKNGFLSFLVLTLITLFSSCQKEALTSEPLNDATDLLSRTAPEQGNKFGTPCFTIIFPVQVQLPDGTIKVISSESELRNLNSKIRKNGNKTKSILSFIFPFDVILDDGTITSITSKEELKLLLESCSPSDKNHKPKTPCYEFVFPISVNFPDGTTQSATSSENLALILREWHKLNPTATTRPSFVFPLAILLDNGTTMTINNKEELNKIATRCKEKHREQRDPQHCFQIQFPFNVTLVDGSIKSINSAMEFQELRANKIKFKLNYPYQVKLVDTGSLVTISNDEELRRLHHSCK